MLRVNSFDIDGVIFMGDFNGVYPAKEDVIITGRSFEERPETIAMLESKGIYNPVYFNPLPFSQKTRVSSGQHKGRTILMLREKDVEIALHFEDDPIQRDEIQHLVPGQKVVLLQHDLVEKENRRHLNWK